MNKNELISNVAARLRAEDARKLVIVPKRTFRIIDDDGNSRSFSVKGTSKGMLYTVDDVAKIIDSVLESIADSLARGEDVVIHGFGSFSKRYRVGRLAKHPETGEWLRVDGRWVPKFSSGKNLRTAVKLYELSLEDKEERDEYMKNLLNEKLKEEIEYSDDIDDSEDVDIESD